MKKAFVVTLLSLALAVPSFAGYSSRRSSSTKHSAATASKKTQAKSRATTSTARSATTTHSHAAIRVSKKSHAAGSNDGAYQGGAGSSHKGEHYKNAKTGDHYRDRKGGTPK